MMMNELRCHACEFRVYYEDTDAGGIVYYANYLKFAERARTEMLRAAGIHQSQLSAQQGIGFVVRRAGLELLKPARLDDVLRVESSVEKMAASSLTIAQTISKNNEIITSISTLIVCVSFELMKPQRIPGDIRSKFERYSIIPAISEPE
jgi:acyl-CoA thioester hydrolase